MPNYDHQAIRRAYPNVVTIGNSLGIFDGSGNEVTVDQAKIDEARVEIDAEEAALFYRKQRTGEAGTTDTIYASVGDQLDMQYKDKINGTSTWTDHVAAVKAKYPKPS
tara:strand:- start:86 stop:409 length:324 start_codon:yes stop_codon:yes gene_type:complete